MDRKEQTLARGYLWKSPVKNKDKSNFSKFWKKRWCVFVEVLHLDVNEAVEDSKLVLNYFKDEESCKNHEQYKGQLNISQCQSIRSCHNSQAGFDHTFILQFENGQVARFSAETCEFKFKWVMMLYKYRFNSNIESIVRQFGIPGCVQQGHSLVSWKANNSNQIFEDLSEAGSNEFSRRSSSLKSGRNSVTKRHSCDSGMFSPFDSLSIDSQCDDPPPLPPRRLSGLDDRDHSNYDSEKVSSPASEESGFDMEMLQIFNDLFTFCSKCKSEPKRKDTISRERRRSKKWDNHKGDIQEVQRTRRSMHEGDNVSQHSSTSEDSLSCDHHDPYTKIDENWLRLVKDKLTETGQPGLNGEGDSKIISVEDKSDVKSDSGQGVSSEGEPKQEAKTADKKEAEKSGENVDCNAAHYEEEDIYMDMSKCKNGENSDDNMVDKINDSTLDKIYDTKTDQDDGNATGNSDDLKEFLRVNGELEILK